MSREVEICDGRRFLGLVRERHDGSFIAVAEQVIGPFPTASSATDAVLEIASIAGAARVGS